MTFIQINEVGPRDGLQNEQKCIATDTKIAFIDALSDSGLTYIEATSFVSPKWIPQLADHRAVFCGIHKQPNIHYPVLIPNLKGLETAIDCGVTDIAVFTAASEAFTQKNTNCSIAESLSRIEAICAMAKKHHIRIRGYISCVIACPYAGDTDPALVTEMTAQLLDLDCYEVSLGDTIGVGTPERTEILLNDVLKTQPVTQIAMHFHDTYQHALDNIRQSLKMGLRSFDASVGGLGGCPYADGASGNVSTQEVVKLVERLGYQTGVSIEQLDAALRVLA